MFNEDTNQTLDYKQIEKIEKPEGFEEEAAEEAEEGEEGEEKEVKTRNELIYLTGRLYQNEKDRWIYEGYDQCLTSEQQPDLVKTLGELNKKALEEHVFYTNEFKRAEEAIRSNEEERRAAAKAAASKKKKGKKDAKDDDDDKKDDFSKEQNKDLDLNLPSDFGEALKQRVARPFIFGPVEFKNLDAPEFNGEGARKSVVDALERSLYLPRNLCLHGYKVTIKKKTLKRSSTIVKHSRFLKNLEVMPIFPPEPEPVKEQEGEEEGEDDVSEQD